jgi:hypothetical protein
MYLLKLKQTKNALAYHLCMGANQGNKSQMEKYMSTSVKYILRIFQTHYICHFEGTHVEYNCKECRILQ